MKNLHINTPLIESLAVSKALPGKVWLKLEAMQPSGSFKTRGVGYACQQYVAAGAKSLLASSGGNAGLAVAYAGRCLGTPVTIIVPTTTKQRAIDLITAEGAEVIVYGESWNEAHEYALQLTTNESAYIHPFDDPYLWQGHASLIDEVVADGIKPDVVVLSVGGGGLLCGVVEGLKRHDWLDVPILAVETFGADSLHTAVSAKAHIGIDSIQSIATSLGAKKVTKQAFDYAQTYDIIPYLVSDEAAVHACWRFLEDHRIMVEPACGASLTAVYDGCDFLQNKENILVIVCGGVGVTMSQLEAWRSR